MPDARLQEILLDRERGAEELLIDALARLRARPESLDPSRRAETFELLRTARPAMAGFSVLADRLEALAGELERSGTGAVLAALTTELRASGERLARRAVERLRTVGARRVLTLSYSSTVAAVLEAAGEAVAEVAVLESLPDGEGRQLAARLRRTRAVAIVADRDLSHAVARADTGLIGADSVYPDGSVLNKLGSTALARRLHDAGKPLFVLATTWKCRGSLPRETPSQNGVFERVPARWITQILSDSDLE